MERAAAVRVAEAARVGRSLPSLAAPDRVWVGHPIFTMFRNGAAAGRERAVDLRARAWGDVSRETCPVYGDGQHRCICGQSWPQTEREKGTQHG